MKWIWPPAIIAAVVVFVVVGGLTTRARRAELEAEALKSAVARAKLEAITKDERYGATLGQLQSERDLVKALTEKQLELYRAAQKADRGVRVDSSSKTTVAISDTIGGHVTTKPGQSECVDVYHRFHAIIPSTGECSVERRQLFYLTQLFIRSADGKTRIGQTDFKELDPVTKEVIPTTGVDMKTEFTFTYEPAAKPPIIHLRPLAGVDHRGAIAGGAEFLNLERTEKPLLERLSLGAMGYWKSGTDLRAALRAGYRIAGNVSIGGYYGWEIPKLTPVVGADVTVQLGR